MRRKTITKQSTVRGRRRKKKKKKSEQRNELISKLIYCKKISIKCYVTELGLTQAISGRARPSLKTFQKKSPSLSFSYKRIITGDDGPLSFFKCNASPLGYGPLILYAFPLLYYCPGPFFSSARYTFQTLILIHFQTQVRIFAWEAEWTLTGVITIPFFPLQLYQTQQGHNGKQLQPLGITQAHLS